MFFNPFAKNEGDVTISDARNEAKNGGDIKTLDGMKEAKLMRTKNTKKKETQTKTTKLPTKIPVETKRNQILVTPKTQFSAFKSNN